MMIFVLKERETETVKPLKKIKTIWRPLYSMKLSAMVEKQLRSEFVIERDDHLDIERYDGQYSNYDDNHIAIVINYRNCDYLTATMEKIAEITSLHLTEAGWM